LKGGAMPTDHDMVTQHELILNGQNGIVEKVHDIESWKAKYLLEDRSKSCIGSKALVEYIESERIRKEEEGEMTKTKINSFTLIVVAAISAIPGIATLLLQVLKK
jgi:hypothetical protein